MSDLLLTVDEVAERLRISRDYAYRLVAKGEFRLTRVGRRRLVSESALQEFIDSKTDAPRRSRKGAAA